MLRCEGVSVPPPERIARRRGWRKRSVERRARLVDAPERVRHRVYRRRLRRRARARERSREVGRRSLRARDRGKRVHRLPGAVDEQLGRRRSAHGLSDTRLCDAPVLDEPAATFREQGARGGGRAERVGVRCAHRE